MRISSHYDYITFFPGGPVNELYSPTKPPLNIIASLGTVGSLALYASLAATAASTTMSVVQSQNQAKQAELNAKAESNALTRESQRQQLELEENRRRLAREQRRFRSTQLSRIADSGIMTGTGTALALEADTWARQQTELADQTYLKNLTQSELGYKAGQALELGKQNASQLRAGATGTVLSGIGSMAGTVGGVVPRRTTTSGTVVNSSGTVLNTPSK
jgi:hypothetical protein